MADVFLSVARGPVGFNKLAVVKRLRTQAIARTSRCSSTKRASPRD